MAEKSKEKKTSKFKILWSKYRWYFIGGIVVIAVMIAMFMKKSSSTPTTTTTPTQTPVGSQTSTPSTGNGNTQTGTGTGRQAFLNSLNTSFQNFLTSFNASISTLNNQTQQTQQTQQTSLNQQLTSTENNLSSIASSLYPHTSLASSPALQSLHQTALALRQQQYANGSSFGSTIGTSYAQKLLQDFANNNTQQNAQALVDAGAAIFNSNGQLVFSTPQNGLSIVNVGNNTPPTTYLPVGQTLTTAQELLKEFQTTNTTG